MNTGTFIPYKRIKLQYSLFCATVILNDFLSNAVLIIHWKQICFEQNPAFYDTFLWKCRSVAQIRICCSSTYNGILNYCYEDLCLSNLKKIKTIKFRILHFSQYEINGKSTLNNNALNILISIFGFFTQHLMQLDPPHCGILLTCDWILRPGRIFGYSNICRNSSQFQIFRHDFCLWIFDTFIYLWVFYTFIFQVATTCQDLWGIWHTFTWNFQLHSQLQNLESNKHVGQSISL